MMTTDAGDLDAAQLDQHQSNRLHDQARHDLAEIITLLDYSANPWAQFFKLAKREFDHVGHGPCSSVILSVKQATCYLNRATAIQLNLVIDDDKALGEARDVTARFQLILARLYTFASDIQAGRQ
jgi:hypothetical protein